MTAPAPLAQAVVFALAVATGEEAVFRGLLTPRRADTHSDRARTAAALAAFVGWHVLQGTVWPPTRRWFWRADFLTATALLGMACTALRQRSGSIWPGVALHAAAIVIWRTGLGGPSFSQLRGRS